MKETVYIETSVVSYFESKPGRDLVIAGRQEITREKLPKILEFFEVYISTLVLQEAEQGDPEAAQKRLNVITNLPDIAITTVNGIDYLLTWNFTHINNAQMKSKIISVVEKYGYPCPIICSPEELLGE